MKMKRVSRVVKMGNLEVGGENPVRIKGMLKTSAKDKKGLAEEAKRLEAEGAQALRVAVKDKESIELACFLKKHINVPITADVHFQPEIALGAIKEGFDCVRINPMNISNKEDVKKIAKAAKAKGISIRVGLNSGGFKKDFSSPLDLAWQMVKKTEEYLKILEDQDFFDIMVSMKGSDVISTVAANEALAQKCDYPIHLGVTASGPFLEGIIKSSIGLGTLLCNYIGDIIRVSLTAPSFWEIRAAKHILQALDLGRFGPEIISCPTCSRCEVNLMDIVDKFKKKMEKEKIDKPLRIAVMGCVVNGPGEAYQADIGAAFGKKKAAIFKKDKILGYSDENKIITDLIKEIKRM